MHKNGAAMTEADARVGRVLDTVQRFDVIRLRRIRAEWDSANVAERKLAWQAVKQAVEATGRKDIIQDAKNWIIRWAQSNTGAQIGWTSGVGKSVNATTFDSRMAAIPPIFDATAAVAFADILDADEYNVLYGPFSTGIAGS